MQDELDTPSFLREDWEHAWEDLAKHVRDGLAFVSEVDGRVTGFVVATIPRELPGLLHVTDLYVAPEARRGGVGRTLMNAVVSAGRERGIGLIGLDVRVDKVAATALYRRLGFVDHERFMTAELDTVITRSEQTERPRSYASTHVQTDDEAGVRHALEQFMPRLGHSARTDVMPPRNGWITVVDELCGRDRSAQRRLGSELSDPMGLPLVALPPPA